MVWEKFRQRFGEKFEQMHCKTNIHTLQEDQRIRTFASAGKNSDLLRVPLPAAMFDVNWKNPKFY